MKKNILLGVVATAGVVLSLGLSNTTAQAATIQTPITGTSYIQKGNTYKLHLKEPGRVIITTKAKYTLVNTSSWKCIPYPGSSKYSKVFYLRAGNYKLTTTSKNAKIKTSYTKITKLKNSLDTFPITRNSNTYNKPDKIKMGQKVKGFLDIYKTYESSGYHYYQFTLDKPQKVTLNISTMPIYDVKKMISHTYVGFENTDDDFDAGGYTVKYQVKNKKHSWYLPKGTYTMGIRSLRGRYNFTLNSEDSDVFPTETRITNITSVPEGIKVEYTKSDNATGYTVYAHSKEQGYVSGTYGSYEATNGTSLIIPKSSLVNGNTYSISLRGVKVTGKNYTDRIYGNRSDSVSFTYYAPTDTNETAPKALNIAVSYYDDNGSDEPYINIAWNENADVDSYEVAYRVKGQEDWHTFTTNEKNGTELTDSNDKNDPLYFEKGKTYEIKVRALRGTLKGDWSDIKTTTVTVDPAR